MDDFLEIDPKSLSNEALVEMISALRDHALSGSRVKKDRERIAKEWCVALGVSEEEFKRIASGK